MHAVTVTLQRRAAPVVGFVVALVRQFPPEVCRCVALHGLPSGWAPPPTPWIAWWAGAAGREFVHPPTPRTQPVAVVVQRLAIGDTARPGPPPNHVGNGRAVVRSAQVGFAHHAASQQQRGRGHLTLDGVGEHRQHDQEHGREAEQ